MSSVNKPEDIQLVYGIISDRISELTDISKEQKEQKLARVVLRLREAILKSYIIVGFPKVYAIDMQSMHVLIILIYDSLRPSMHCNNLLMLRLLLSNHCFQISRLGNYTTD